MPDVVSLCAVVEQSVTPTNSSPVVLLIASSPPHHARHLPLAGIISWSVDSRLSVHLSTRLDFSVITFYIAISTLVFVQKGDSEGYIYIYI